MLGALVSGEHGWGMSLGSFTMKPLAYVGREAIV